MKEIQVIEPTKTFLSRVVRSEHTKRAVATSVIGILVACAIELWPTPVR